MELEGTPLYLKQRRNRIFSLEHRYYQAYQVRQYLTNQVGLVFTNSDTIGYNFDIFKHAMCRTYDNMYFAFVIKDSQIVHVAVVHTRKRIHEMLLRFVNYKVIIYYPVSRRMRYYLPNRTNWIPNDFNTPVRVELEFFKTHDTFTMHDWHVLTYGHDYRYEHDYRDKQGK